MFKNVIYINTHDTGRWIEPYGYNVKTPNLMALAKDAMVFRNAYSAAPNCSPSRASLLTSLYPHQNGVTGLSHRGYSITNPEYHMANLFSNNGYETVVCGVAHETAIEDMHKVGYQKTYQQPFKVMDYETEGMAHNRIDKKTTEDAVSYINSKKDKPFYMAIGFVNTHREYPETDIDDRYVKAPYPVIDNEMTRKEYAQYLESANYMDSCVGEIINALKKNNMYNNTIIIFTTDHGVSFPGMKCTLKDPGIGVSLIIKFIGEKCKGRVSDILVSQIDIVPTLCDYLGLYSGKDAIPRWAEGASLLLAMDAGDHEIREEIYAEHNDHLLYEPMRCIRTKRYKLICCFEGDKNASYMNTAGGKEGIKPYLLSHGVGKKKDKIQLYDLELDVGEMNNLVNNEEYREVRDQLIERLQDWMNRTGDFVEQIKL